MILNLTTGRYFLLMGLSLHLARAQQVLKARLYVGITRNELIVPNFYPHSVSLLLKNLHNLKQNCVYL